MNISSSNQRKAGVILQYLQMGLSILISILYTPIMLKILGDNEYGIYNVSNSIISYLSLLSLGFGASYIRYYSIFRKTDKDRIKHLNGMYLSVFIIIGIVALMAGLALSANVSIFYNDTYSENDLHIAKILMIFLSINLAISFPSSVFTSYITSQEKFIWQKVINMCTTVLSPASNIILLYLGYGSIGMVITSTTISVIVALINIWYCFKKLNMEVSFKKFDWRLLKDIFVFSIFIAINQIIDLINYQTDKIILGKLATGSAVAIYAVGANINTMYTQFSTAISSVFAPKVNMIVQNNEPDRDSKLTTLFIKVGRIQWFLLSLILTGFIFFGQYFIIRWAGEKYAEAYYIALLLICPAIVPLSQNIGIEIQRAKNKHQFRSLIYLFIAIFNVIFTIILVPYWGGIGAAFATCIACCLGQILTMNIYYHKAIKINIIAFWKSIARASLSFIVPIVCGICLMKFYTFHNLIDFAIFIVAYTIIYSLCVYFFGFNDEEKEIVKNVKNKIFKKGSSE